MSFLFYLSNMPFEFSVDLCSYINKKLKLRPSSKPFLSGDTYRSVSDFLYDETHLCTSDDINSFEKSIKDSNRKNPVVFVSSWNLEGFVKDVLKGIKKDFVLVTHQGDVNITQKPLFEKIINSKHLIHWFAQNCILKNKKVTPLPIGLEDRWRHNAGAVADFRKGKYRNNAKKPRILYGFSLNTNPDKRVPCYLAFSKAKAADLIYRAPTSHLYRRKLSKYMFVASPEGNGLDCHRTWEAMLLGVVPLVNDNAMNKYFASLGLPMICVSDWKKIAGLNENQLAEKYKAVMEKSSTTALYLNYWLDKINSFTN